MKGYHFSYLMKSAGLLMAAALVASQLWGCGLGSAVDSSTSAAIHSFDSAIGQLRQESADWRLVVSNLESQMAEDAQSTLRTEVENLTRMAILSAGAELRCNAEFMRLRLRADLIRMRNSLAESLNAKLEGRLFSQYQIPLLPEEQAHPYICDVVPAHIDLGINPNRRAKIDIYGFNLRSAPISVGYRGLGLFLGKLPITVGKFDSAVAAAADPAGRLVRAVDTHEFQLRDPSSIIVKDISAALSIVTDFHAVLDLTDPTAEVPPNATQLVISWANRVQCEVPITTHIATLHCEVTDYPVNPGTSTFVPPRVHNGGDADFHGNGPSVLFHMDVYLDPARRVLLASYVMKAWESEPDFWTDHGDCTQAYGVRTDTLYVARDGETILSFDVTPTFDHHYRDKNHDDDVFSFAGTSPVRQLKYKGDTSGPEAGTDTRVEITYAPIKMRIQKCEYR